MRGGYVKTTSNCEGLPLGWDAEIEIVQEVGRYRAALVRTGEDLEIRRVVGWTDLFNGRPCPVDVYRVRDGEGTEALLLCGGNSGLRILANADDADWRTEGVDDHLPNGQGMPIMWIGDASDLVCLIAEEDDTITVAEASELYNLATCTLTQAVREHRLDARKSGGTWLTTRAAVERAIAEGRLNPHS